MKRKKSPPDGKLTTSASSVDQRAYQAILERNRRQRAELNKAQRQEQAKANMRVSPSVQQAGIMQHFAKPPSQGGRLSIEEFERFVELASPPKPKPPIKADRDWPQLLHDAEGIVSEARDATGGLSYVHTMRLDADTVEFADLTGIQSAPVHSATFTDDDLRNPDASVGVKLDKAVRAVVRSDANRMLDGSINRFAGDGELLDAVADMMGLYPAFYMDDQIGHDEENDWYVVRFAVAWIYEEGLDGDDDD